jgi:hypothetical protein
MAAMLGKKPLITETLFHKAQQYLLKSDKRNIPHFVKALEEKEKYLADQIMGHAEYLAKSHADRIREQHDIELSESEISTLTLDFYITAWFHYLLLDIARDRETEQWLKETYEQDYDESRD